MNSALVLTGGFAVLAAFGDHLFGRLGELWRQLFGNLASIQLGAAQTNELMRTLLLQLAIMLAPVLAAVTVVAMGSNLLQIGLLFSTQAVAPSFDRINPLKGFSRIASKEALLQLGRSLIKILIIGYVGYVTVRGEIDRIPTLPMLEVTEIAHYIVTVSSRLVWRVCALLLLLGILDYGVRRWEFERGLRMTKQEVKEETKQREGDPHIKARVRSLQRDMARRRMMAAVPKADVVVTNPTHFAVALLYERGRMEAPQVVAKGRNHLALRIREVAQQHGVPIVEDQPLARALYDSTELNHAVPVNLYKAVAEVIAYVYRLKRKVVSYPLPAMQNER